MKGRGGGIEAKEKAIGDLFSDQFVFRIPEYQRPLSWNNEHFSQLIDDISDAIDSGEEQYFLGSIILQGLGENRYDIVDGQQRLTALAVLMAVIRDSTNDDQLKSEMQDNIYQREIVSKDIPPVMRIEPWEDLADLFRVYVYTPNGTARYLDDFEKRLVKYKDAEDPRYHLFESIKVFGDRIPDDGSIWDFVRYLSKRVFIVYVNTPTISSAFRLFNVLNTRGLSLNTSDILKSENLGAIDDEEKRVKYARTWRDMEETIGREELESTIGYMRTIKTAEKAKLGMYEEYQELFKKGTFNRGPEFIDYVRDVSDIYNDKILEGKLNVEDKEEQNRYGVLIDIMNRFVPFSDWIPPLLSFFSTYKSEDHLSEFLRQLERKTVLEWAAGFTYTERITSLNRIIKLVDVSKNPQDVVENMLLYTGKGGVPPKRVLNYGNRDEIRDTLMKVLDDPQFYAIRGGRFAKYILLRLDMELWDLENFPGYPGTLTVEHVLPQNPSKSSDWISLFSDDERSELTNKLGNLVLLSGRKNSRARNFDFAKKKKVYFQHKSTPFMITQRIQKYAKWDVESLQERHSSLMTEATKIYVD